jgi:cbb3-type cytochrome oxidase maturation protein
MNIIYLLIPIALVLVSLGVAAFLWAVKSDQFEDLEGPAHRILFDDDELSPPDTDDSPEEPTDHAGNPHA